MSRLPALLYAVFCYSLFGAVSVWAIMFLGNLGLNHSIDSPATAGNQVAAIVVNSLLILMFGVQHSVMARPWFKDRWTKIVPQPLERSTYMLFSCIALGLVLWFWQPMGGVIWEVKSPLLRSLVYVVYFGGWLTIVGSSHLINHYDLFGLRQAWLYYQGRPYTALPFATPGLYRWVRHPLYVGWLMTFWAAPTMTWSHLLFALGMTAYILVAIPLEERDLLAYFGDAYAIYRKRVPALLPRPWQSKPAQSGAAAEVAPTSGIG